MNLSKDFFDAIEILIEEKIKNNTQIYVGRVVGASGNRCSVEVNGKRQKIKFYGDAPLVNSICPVFVPQGNMSVAFTISNEVLVMTGTFTAGNGINISNTGEISVNVVELNGLSLGFDGVALALATSEANGAMSSDDKSKLNNIENQATKNTKYVITNGDLTSSNGVWTWQILASTHGIVSNNIIIQIYEIASGRFVMPDITISPSTYDINIIINDTKQVGNLAANTYRVVIIE